jgi:hypothetical protein
MCASWPWAVVACHWNNNSDDPDAEVRLGDDVCKNR